MTCERPKIVTNASEDAANVAKFERLPNIYIRKYFASIHVFNTVLEQHEKNTYFHTPNQRRGQTYRSLRAVYCESYDNLRYRSQFVSPRNVWANTGCQTSLPNGLCCVWRQNGVQQPDDQRKLVPPCLNYLSTQLLFLSVSKSVLQKLGCKNLIMVVSLSDIEQYLKIALCGVNIVLIAVEHNYCGNILTGKKGC